MVRLVYPALRLVFLMLIFNVYSIFMKKIHTNINYINLKTLLLCPKIRISHARTLWMNQKFIHTLLVLM